MIYCFDIDGTLCTNTDGAYDRAEPCADVIDQINRLYDVGHQILLFTGRGTVTGIDWRPLTEQQLPRWGVRYHKLHMGKPAADVYIDDKAINVADWVRAGFRVSIASDP
jgi:hypothetical protein